MINLDPDVLRTFVAIAENGSYARAAEVVHKTQSTISMQMKRLEEALDVPVFRKEGRRNVMTEEGQQLLEYARRLVRLNDEAVRIFSCEQLAGSVRIGTPDDYAECYLPQILARFAQTHPKVEVTVICEPSLKLADLIAAGDVDVAIVTCEGPAHAARIIRREMLHWVTSERHCAHCEPVLPLAVAQLGCTWRKIAIDALDRAGMPYRIAYTSANGAAVSAAVLSGLAVAPIPEATMKPGMRVLGRADGFPPLEAFGIGLLKAPGLENPVAEALAEHVVESLGTQTPIAAPMFAYPDIRDAAE